MATYKHIGQSKPCKFRVGPEKAIFYVHHTLISERAPKLHAATAEGERDVSRTSVTLEAIDSDTFACAVEYLYTGDYTCTAPVQRVQHVDESLGESSGDEDNFTPASSKVYDDDGTVTACGFGGCMTEAIDEQPESFDWPSAPKTCNKKAKACKESMVKETKEGTKQAVFLRSVAAFNPSRKKSIIPAHQQAWDKFLELTWPGVNIDPIATQHSDMSNEDPEQDFTPALLCHARLHVFACIYDLARLQALTLTKLHATLIGFKIYESHGAEDIAELLKYCYQDTRSSGSHDEIKKLVNDYVACNVQKLMQQSCFHRAMRDCGEASLNLLELIVQRVARSAPVKFIIGPQEKEMYIHAAVINGSQWLEDGGDQAITIENCDEATFSRFVDLLDVDYDVSSSDDTMYTPSEASTTGPDDVLTSSKTRLLPMTIKHVKQAANSGWRSSWATKPAAGQSGSLRDQAWDRFTAISPPRPEELPKVSWDCVEPNTDLHEDYTGVFLSHARLHAFALSHDVKGLEKLSLYRLYQTLKSFQLHDERVGDIAALFEYCYGELEYHSEAFALRAVVADYVACHVEKLAFDSVFAQTLCAPNEAAADVIQRLLGRLDR
ncbi:Putative SKP1/BTB/POZ domain superfamily protein [Septoria linicola]|uniref:SKP1/BTB/POZ domain superfamily protein n=1 Tax=Septoria linicola TaxID=215465 RepID=A0A9Q9B8W4_9PEZI|nr:Putative SKP1/BTB/POZ domain superfamily protein [Septoria linicola]